MNNIKQRIVFLNGEFIPEDEAKVSIRDVGLVYGDCVFDTSRTFNGRLFRLQDHIDRLYKSLDYAQIDPGMTPREIKEATEYVVDQNQSVLREGEDYWVTQRVTSGLQPIDGEINDNNATVIVDAFRYRYGQGQGIFATVLMPWYPKETGFPRMRYLPM